MSEKMRDEFEEWAKREGYYVDTIDDYLTAEMDGLIAGSYRSYEVRVSWQAWKASRAALVVELPELKSFNASDEADFAYEVAIDDIKCALDDAGVGYK